MTRKEFLALDIDARANILWRDGVYLDERAIYNHAYVKLFYLDGHFIEVFMDVNTTRIQQVLPIDEEETLHWYLDVR
jgi:hypothetical protein